MNNLLFGDLGLRYLKFLILLMIEQIKNEPQKLVLNRDDSSRDKTLKILEEFIRTFQGSALRCPV